MTKEKDQSLAQKEHSNIKVENRFVGIVMKDIIATKKGHYTAQLVQKETGVIKMTKEKRQFLVQKEHSNIKVGNHFVGIVMKGITVLR